MIPLILQEPKTTPKLAESTAPEEAVESTERKISTKKLEAQVRF